MDRRRFIVGLGGAAVGTTGVIGSGAFSRTDANRSITIGIAADDRAYLALDVIDGEVARQNEIGVLEVRFDDERPKDADGEGFAAESVYEIVGITADRIFDIRNQGTRTVELAAETIDDEGPTVELFDVDDDSRTAIDETNPAVLEPGGDWLRIGLRIIVPEDVSIEKYDQTVQIRAEVI